MTYIDEDQIRALLQRIRQETNYRELMIADPVQALSMHGIAFDAANVPANGVTLPTNDRIDTELDALTNAVITNKSHVSAFLAVGE